MDNQTLAERHERARQFLEDQANLDELLAEHVPAPTLYEPIIQTGDRRLLHIGPGSRIDSFVKLEIGMGMRIGRYVHIASFAHIGIGGGLVELEDYTAVASGGRLISGSNQVDAVTMSACAPAHLQRVAKSSVVLKRYAVVLAGGIVLPGVTLHEGAVLAAGGLATKDIPAWEIWGGVPARPMGRRVVR